MYNSMDNHALCMFLSQYTFINHLKIKGMQRLFLFAIFAIVAFVSNSQIVTITGFGLSQANGPILVKNDFTEILLDLEFRYKLDEDVPFSYKYVVDFDAKHCMLYNGDGVLVAAVGFKVIRKISDRDFQIEIIDVNSEDQYGIVVKGTEAAYYLADNKAVSLFIFEALYIY